MIPQLEQRPRPRSRQQLIPSQPPWLRRWLSTPRSTRPRRRLRTPPFPAWALKPRPLPKASLLLGFCTHSASLDRRRPCNDTPPGSRVAPGERRPAGQPPRRQLTMGPSHAPLLTSGTAGELLSSPVRRAPTLPRRAQPCRTPYRAESGPCPGQTARPASRVASHSPPRSSPL